VPGAHLIVDAPTVALAIFAHPDCPIVNCGGALAAWARLGTEAHLVVVTRGERGGDDADAADSKVVDQRARNLEQSAQLLGLTSIEVLDFPDGEVVNDLELRRAIVQRVRRHRPDAVLFHDPTAVIYGDRYVSHPDHRAVGWACLDAVGAPSAGARYHPDLGPPHAIADAYLCGSLEPDAFVLIDAVVEAKAAALRHHAGEAGDAEWITAAVRARAADAGETVGVANAEGFRRLRLG
jgi:LmbE family N-acetylglucosaminyl deacetylase